MRKIVGFFSYVAAIVIIVFFGCYIFQMTNLTDVSIYIGYPISIIALLTVGALCAIPTMIKSQTKLLALKITVFLAFIPYCVFMFALLFSSGRYLVDNHSIPFELYAKNTINLVPFNFIISGFSSRSFLQFIGNIILFVPLGLTYPYFLHLHNSKWRKLFCFIILPLSIELIQLIARIGICDIDDFIAYIIGAYIGAIVYKSNFVQKIIFAVFQLLHISPIKPISKL